MKNSNEQPALKNDFNSLAWLKIDSYQSKKVQQKHTLLHDSLAWLKR